MNSRVHFLANAFVGALVWLFAIIWLPAGWPEALFLFAPLVLVPLALRVLASPDWQSPDRRIWQGVKWLQFPAALMLAWAFSRPPGILGASGAVPWLVVTYGIACLGLLALWNERPRSMPQICQHAGMLFLAVGGSWAVLSRLGARPLGFSDLIVLATAVHFHYAGFVLPLITGWAGQILRDWPSKVAAAGVVMGVPLVALGITLSAFGLTLLEWLAAWLMSASALLVSVLQIRLAFQAQSRITRLLFAVSGFSLVIGMVLAAVYALGHYLGLEWLEIPQMLPFHGAVNALGFALPAVVAWNLESGNPAGIAKKRKKSGPECRLGDSNMGGRRCEKT